MEGMLCITVIVVAIVAILVVRGNAAKERQEALSDAKFRYDKALAELKRDPTSAARRQHALEQGRAYAALSRESKGTTIFDEMALKNDLDAATAGAAAAAPAVSTPPSPVPSIADRLRQLDELRAQNLITDEEHQARRAKILEGV